MFNPKRFLIILSLFVFQFNGIAQGPGSGMGPMMMYRPRIGKTLIRLEHGEIALLRGVTKINIKYDYSNMSVGAFRSEKDYLNKKEQEYKNEPKQYEEFLQEWINSRFESFEPCFERALNKYGKKIGMTGENYADTNDVTLVVETLFLELGSDSEIINTPASIDLLCTFKDKAGNEIARYFVKNAIGIRLGRIVDSYAKGCEVLMNDVIKRLKKVK